MRLVAFITDVQPPDEDEAKKGGKDKKGAASRAGKKGKEDGMMIHLHQNLFQSYSCLCKDLFCFFFFSI